jgi:hypothetical protein
MKLFLKFSKRFINFLGLRLYIQRLLFNFKRNRFEAQNIGHFYRQIVDVSRESQPETDLLIVSPWVNPIRQPWRFSCGNYFFEIYQSALELFPEKIIKVKRIEFHESDWIRNLSREVLLLRAKNLLIQVETDPDGTGNWNIDVFVRVLKDANWNGQIFLLTYDSVFPLHMFRIDRVARIFRKVVVISIDRSCAGFYRGNAPNIGPGFLPISEKSINVLTTHFQSIERRGEGAKKYGLTFIGAEYPYRTVALQAIRDEGLSVSVNPQRHGLLDSTYEHYAEAIHSSIATLNFSRAHVIDLAQLKSRVIEAMLFKCIVITDDEDLINRFFTLNEDFLLFKSPKELVTIFSDLLTDQEKQDFLVGRAYEKAVQVNRTSFWGEVEKYLC